MQNHILQLLQQLGFKVEESGCWTDLPAVQIFHIKQTFGASLNEKYAINSSAVILCLSEAQN